MKKYSTFCSLFLFFFFQISPLFAQNYNNTLRSTVSYPGQNLANVCGYWQNGEEYALVGASQGLAIVDITDPDNPVQIVQIPGPNNRWKEIKTYQHFAYITSEGGQGVQIVDLSALPSPILNSHFYTGTGALAGQLNKIHALHIDTTAGFLYCFGGNQSGATIHDLNADPYNPTYVSQYQAGGYIHDAYVDNDTLYACHIYAGTMAMVDMRNKANPVFLGSVETPNKFTHNAWILPDRKHILTTDERTGSYLAAYDITDPSDITELDRMQTTPGSGSIVHNTHLTGNYAVSSWYRDGYNIVDAYRPQNLVQVGSYDTWPTQSGNGFDGCWGVYPFFPSGTIIASNINPADLLILTPTYKPACYVEGVVRDACTGAALNGAEITINSNDPLTATTSNFNGIFRTGQPTTGAYIVTVHKAGYVDQTFNVDLLPHQVIDLQVELYLPSAYTQLPPISLCVGESVNICGQNYTSGGTFTATCSSSIGCDSLVQFTINAAALSASIQGNTTISCAAPATTLFFNANSGITAMWYVLGETTPFAQAQTISVSAAGTYVLELTQPFGNATCSAFDTITVTANTADPALSTTSGTLTCAATSVEIVASSPTASNFAWSGPNGFSSASPNPSVTTPGAYTVVATDGFGCTATKTLNVTANTIQPIGSINTLELDCNQPSGVLTVQSVIPYTYSWSNGVPDASVQVAASGVYDVTLTDLNNGCSTILSTTVTTDFAHPHLNLESTGHLTCDNSFVELTASSTTAALTYAWSTNETSPLIMVNQPGDYGVTVTGANGCTSFNNVTVDENADAPVVQLNANGSITCVQSSVTLAATANAAVSYEWTGGGTIGTGSSFEVSQAGTVTVVATGTNGCRSTKTFQVVADVALPTIAAVSDGSITCANSSVNLIATIVAGNNCVWIKPDTNFVQSTTLNTSQSGTYTAVVTNPVNGCSNTTTVTVNTDISDPLLIASGGSLDCNTTSVLLQANTNTPCSYSWTGPFGASYTGATPAVSNAGTYTVIAQSLSNGCTAQATVQVAAAPTIAPIQIADTLDCCTSSINLSASVHPYLWPVGQDSMVILPGIFTVVVTDPASGCTTIATFTITVHTHAVNLGAMVQGSLTCQASSTVTLMATATGLTNPVFSWTGPNNYSSNVQNPTVSAAGTYILEVTDVAHCCTSTATVTVAAAPTLAPIQIADTLDCCTPVINLSAGVLPYLWPTGQNSMVSTAGTYTATVTDPTTACTTTATFAIAKHLDTLAVAVTGGVLTCAIPTVMLTSQVSGATNPSYSWTGPNGFTSMSQNPTVNAAGSYVVRVEDLAHCCFSTAFTTVLDSCLISTGQQSLEKALLKVYPNATAGLVNIQSLDAQHPIDAVSVFGSDGRLILNKNIEKSINTQLDLSNYAVGIYTLQVFSEGKYWTISVMRN